MTSFHFKKMVVALCLMTSLFIGSASACTCSHHEVTKSLDADCHSHHESAETVEAAETVDAIDETCICVVNQRVPYVASKSESKDVKTDDSVSKPEQNTADFKFIAATTFLLPSPEFTNDLSYSNTLKTLLPSRAPPRL